ncbi:hypothetical protein FH609_006745 [Streptomyces sp. 3MP-14]|uniref:Uncharacterized protein n=1 Tax=Streptomyces mimosae TaxID=2586635 RepID=A0A5N6AJN7_9ACTN|nr:MULTISPECIES: hypothetical protein [Streptomyces]KAB8168884.1 hypothetical protein FH607_006620 [Streptomyces mimosae]KAB8177837.1 hypothetical protein FH609_006745 [Streptomyces sp. 3MP-14]
MTDDPAAPGACSPWLSWALAAQPAVLTGELAAGRPAPGALPRAEWQTVVQLVRPLVVNRDSSARSVPSWATSAAALEYVLVAAVEAGAMRRRDAVVSRLHASRALLRTCPPRPGVPLLDPRHQVELALAELPLTEDEARAGAANWRAERDIATMRRLRGAKLLLTPLLALLSDAGPEWWDERLTAWAVLLPDLP